jgi:hypothetical protein
VTSNKSVSYSFSDFIISVLSLKVSERFFTALNAKIIMKIYLNLLIVFFVFLSCQSSDEVFYDGGISLTIINYTEKSYEKATLYIGAIKESDFIVTDSLLYESNIKVKKNDEQFTKSELTVGTFGWTPELDKIESHSENGAFLLTLKDGPKLFFNPFKFPKTKLDGVNLSVRIENDTLFVFDGEIEKQDFNVVK